MEIDNIGDWNFVIIFIAIIIIALLIARTANIMASVNDNKEKAQQICESYNGTYRSHDSRGVVCITDIEWTEQIETKRIEVDWDEVEER